MESNDELIANLKEEVKDELKDKFNETAVGYIHVFNKRLEEKLREQGIEYNKEELKIICIHELIHCKHKDILWKQLCGLVRVIHWWNPLVKQLDMDVDSWNETYCDLESTTIMKSKKRYFTTICEIGISPFAKGAYLCAALGEDKNQLKTRILRIKTIEKIEQNDIIIKIVFSKTIINSVEFICIFPNKGIPITKTTNK